MIAVRCLHPPARQVLWLALLVSWRNAEPTRFADMIGQARHGFAQPWLAWLRAPLQKVSRRTVAFRSRMNDNPLFRSSEPETGDPLQTVVHCKCIVRTRATKSPLPSQGNVAGRWKVAGAAGAAGGGKLFVFLHDLGLRFLFLGPGRTGLA